MDETKAEPSQTLASASPPLPPPTWNPAPEGPTGSPTIEQQTSQPANNASLPPAPSKAQREAHSFRPTAEEPNAATRSTPPLNTRVTSAPFSGLGAVLSRFGWKHGSKTVSEIITVPVQSAPALPWRDEREVTGQYRNGRVEHYVNGQRMPPVPIILPLGKLFRMHSLNDGDEIKINGRWKRGQYVKVDRIHNLTTGAVGFRTQPVVLYLILCLFGLAVLYLIGSISLGPVSRLHNIGGGEILIALVLVTLATVIIYKSRSKRLRSPN